MFTLPVSIQILTAQQCEEICSTVHLLRDYWTQVNPVAPFFTLGAASYIEFSVPEGVAGNYYQKARRYNPLLREYFGGMLEYLRVTLEHQLGEPVEFREEFAMPGFHIWLREAIPTQPSASVHFDLQYQRLDWRTPNEIDYERPVSFTLPVKLPAGKGGMNVWDLHFREVESLALQGLPHSIEELQGTRERLHYAYSTGSLVMHSGHFLHQIAPVETVREGDERITLQGHALRCGDRWHLYW
ncbi:MAG: hypothetical protein WCD76_06690 [Pyrinomonadaceae bacterium]